MSYNLIASGGILDVGQFGQLESYIGEGKRGLVEIDLRWSVPQSVVKELENKLRQEGVEEARVTAASPMLRISFRQGFPWLAVIAGVILAMITLAILIVGWRIFREVVPEELQPVVAGIGIFLLLGLGAAVLVRRLR
jgi:hypothetical protein